MTREDFNLVLPAILILDLDDNWSDEEIFYIFIRTAGGKGLAMILRMIMAEKSRM